MPGGRPRKPEAERQGHRQLSVVPLAPAVERFVVPEPPLTNGGVTLLAEALLRWDAYWLSVLPRALDGIGGIDRLVVDDWIRLENELLTLEQVIQEGRAWLVAGSVGQVRINPLLGERHAIRQRLHDLRHQLGIGPKSRAQLGIEAANAMTAEAKMNAALNRAARRESSVPDDYEDAEFEDAEPDEPEGVTVTPRVTRTPLSNAARQKAYRERRRQAKG